MKKKVVVGMSGGVDSSVAALLLKEQGYDVIGVTMEIWDGGESYDSSLEGGCCGLSAAEDARRVCEVLGIPFYVMNFKSEFKEKVVDYFISEYRQGRTPNPCIACNRHIKWQALFGRSMEIGADYIATGHYARVVKLPNGRYTIRKSVTDKKDQTYVLYNLSQEQLAHTLMPVGDYPKEEVRKIAEDAGLPVAHKSESQDICFVPDHDYAGFIERETGLVCQPGEFVDMEGNVLGIHKGIEHYTVGQRKGLGISAEKPLYIRSIEPETRKIVLAGGDEIFSKSVLMSDVNYMGIMPFSGEETFVGKIRYAHKGEKCKVYAREDGMLDCVFEKEQRAVTPGQAIVLYDGDDIACGGTIAKN